MLAIPARPGLQVFTLCLVCLTWELCIAQVRAQPPEGDATGTAVPEDRTIYVPFKDLATALQKHAATAIVPYDEYLKFLRRNDDSPKPPAEAVITRAAYRAAIEEDLARITASYTVNVLGQPWVELPLSFGDAAVGKIDGAGDKVLLRGTGDGTYALLLGETGEKTITLELVVRVRTSPDGREFTLAVPPVGITTLEMTVPESEQSIEVTPRLVALPVEEAAAGTTAVKANLGSTKSITARWHPRTSTRPEMDLLATVTNRQLITIEGGYVHHDAWLTYDVLRGQLPALRIAAPLGQRVLDVSADAGVKSWQAADEAGRQVITVDLLNPVEKSVTVEVHTERTQGEAVDPIAGSGADNVTRGIHALDAVRESGQVAVRVGDGLELTIADQQGLTRIAAGDVDQRLQPGAATAFKFYSPQFALAVSARPIEPRVLVTQSSRLVFDDDELRLEAALQYQVERAGVFELRLQAPDNLVIDDVQSPQMQDESFDAASHVLTIKLQQSTQGQIDVTVKAHRPFDAGKDTAEQDLPLLEPLQVARETGSVLVFAPPGIEVVTNTAGLQSVQPAPAGQVGTQGEAELRSAWNYTRRPVRIPVSTTRKPTRLSATIATAIDVQPETIEVTTALDYRVEFAGVDTFRFLVPEAVSASVQVEAVATGNGSSEIKQKSPGAAENGWVPWTVVMQRKVVGLQGLRIIYRINRDAPAAAGAAVPPPAEAGSVGRELPLIRPQGKPETSDGVAAVPLTQLKGEVRIVKERSLSVTAEASGGDVEPIDVRELTLMPQAGALAYRYYRQPDDAAITVRLTQAKHDIQEVTPTVVERGLVEIAMQRNTPATFRCRYLVQSVERQRLRIDLPRDLDLLGVFIDGHEEKLSPIPSAEAGTVPENVAAYSVNISRRQSATEPFLLTVQFNWNVTPSPFEAPFGRGEIALPLPRLGVTKTGSAPVQQLRAVVYVPQKFWLVGTPDRFTVLGERDWWDGLSGSPQPYPVATDSRLSNAVTPLDFPTDGLVATQYQNLGGAATLGIVWWDIVKMTILLSAALALIAFILLRTSWENRLGLLLILAFIALLFGVKDRDALAHGLAAARFGLAFLVVLWVLHAVLGARGPSSATVSAPPSMPPPDSGSPAPATTGG